MNITDEERQAIRDAFKEIQNIAKTVGGSVGIKVNLGLPGRGSYLDTVSREITVDPVHIYKSPAFAKFVAGHEGMHARITLSPAELGLPAEVIDELYGQLGFGYIQNIVEDGGGNDWLVGTFPGLEDAKNEVYDESFSVQNAAMETPETQEISLRLGRTPLFVQFGSELLRDWHAWRKKLGWDKRLDQSGPGEFSANLHPDVKEALSRALEPSRRAMSSLPEFGNPSAADVLHTHRQRFKIAAEEVYPIAAELIEKDLGAEALRKGYNETEALAKQLNQKTQARQQARQQQGGQLGKQLEWQLDGEIAELQRQLAEAMGITPETLETLREAVKKAISEQAKQVAKGLSELADGIRESRERQEQLDGKLARMKEDQKSASGQEWQSLQEKIQELRELKKEEQATEQELRKKLEEKLEKLFGQSDARKQIEEQIEQEISAPAQDQPQNGQQGGPDGAGESGQSAGQQGGQSGGQSAGGASQGGGAGAQGGQQGRSGSSGQSGASQVSGGQSAGTSGAGGQPGSQSGQSDGAGSQQAGGASSTAGSPAGAPSSGQPGAGQAGASSGAEESAEGGGSQAGPGKDGNSGSPGSLEQSINGALEEKLSAEGDLPLPVGDLPEETREELQQAFDGLSDGKKAELEQQAQESLREIEDLLNQAMQGQLNQSHAPTHEQLNQNAAGAEQQTENAESLDLELEQFSRQQEDLCNERRTSRDPYQRAKDDWEDEIKITSRRLRKAFKPEEEPDEEPLQFKGDLDIEEVISSKAAHRPDQRKFKRKLDPIELDHALVFVVDTSGSMAGPNAEQAHGALVFANESLKPIKVPVATYAFDEGTVKLQDYDDSIDDPRIQEKLASVRDANGGCTNDGDAVRTVYAELRKRPEKYKIMCVFTDAGSSQPEILKRWVNKITADKNTILLHFGLGQGTEDSRKIYPYSVPNLKMVKLDLGHLPPGGVLANFNEVFPRVLEEVLKNPQRFMSYQERGLMVVTAGGEVHLVPHKNA